MTRRIVGGLLAGAFALGILTGSAGTIVVREVATPGTDFAGAMAGHITDMSAMHSMMSGGPMMGPSASMIPGSLHDQHHPEATQ